MNTENTYTVFAKDRHLVTDALEPMLLAAKRYLDAPDAEPLLIFEDATGRQIDFDFRGNEQDVLTRLAEHPLFRPAPVPQKTHAGPGRPKLGVVCREISLLPRHWEWLEGQPGGSSAALRRLVDEARKREPQKVDVTALRDAAARFMSVLAGNLPGYESALRALYAGNYDTLRGLLQEWPADIRVHTERLIARCARAEAAGNTAPCP